MFTGLVEVYNPSSRGNAIQEYRFWERMENGTWQPMESEMYQETNRTTEEVEHTNQTPLGLPPYSGAELRVTAFSRQATTLRELRVRIELEDLFHKTYRTEVTAHVEPHAMPPFPETV